MRIVIGWLMFLLTNSTNAWTLSRRVFLASTLIAQGGNEPPSTTSTIRAAYNTVDQLLNRWEDLIIDCNYADVPRELLESKNKEELLDKASTFALFDKADVVITCKTINSKLRDYLGFTELGALANFDKVLKRVTREVLETDGDYVEEILALVDDIQKTRNLLDGLSYSARRDFTSINNFEITEKANVLADFNSNYYKCRENVRVLRNELKTLLNLLSQ